MSLKIVFYGILGALVVSCLNNEMPHFAVEPYIEARRAVFIDPPGTNIPDTVKVTFYLRDGDFDLGLNPLDIQPPYNRRFYFLNSDGSKVPDTKYQSGAIDATSLVTYKYERTGLLDTLPPWGIPYNCTNWEVTSDPSGIVLDTLYFQSNRNYFNLHLDILKVDSIGSSAVMDLSSFFHYPVCSAGFSARFPSVRYSAQLANTPFHVHMISSEECELTYNIASFGWKYVFAGEKIKFRVQAEDRALHLSNIIETSELQF